MDCGHKTTRLEYAEMLLLNLKVGHEALHLNIYNLLLAMTFKSTRVQVTLVADCITNYVNKSNNISIKTRRESNDM